MAIKYLFHRSVFLMTRGASGHIAVVFHIYFFEDRRGMWP